MGVWWYPQTIENLVLNLLFWGSPTLRNRQLKEIQNFRDLHVTIEEFGSLPALESSSDHFLPWICPRKLNRNYCNSAHLHVQILGFPFQNQLLLDPFQGSICRYFWQGGPIAPWSTIALMMSTHCGESCGGNFTALIPFLNASEIEPRAAKGLFKISHLANGVNRCYQW